MSNINKYKFTTLSIILILIAVLMPSSGVPQVGVKNVDKLVHMGMFLVLTLCFYVEYIRDKSKLPSIVTSVSSLLLFAVSTEIMQSFTPSRSMDISDLYADAIGILVAVIGVIIYRKSIKDKLDNRLNNK